MIRVFLTNLARYNEGELKGNWIDLPIEEEELKEELKNILGTDEEYFITDYEAQIKIREFENIDELNEFANALADMPEHDQRKIYFLINMIGIDRAEAIQKYEDVTFYEGMSLEDVAEDLVDDGLFGEIPERIRPCLDCMQIARDLSFDGFHETEDGVFWYQ